MENNLQMAMQLLRKEVVGAMNALGEACKKDQFFQAVKPYISRETAQQIHNCLDRLVREARIV